MAYFCPMRLLKFLIHPAIAALLLTGCNANDTGSDQSNRGDSNTPGNQGPAMLGHSVVSTYPHDTSSFTQGLMIYKGKLYEGTGNLGRSHLMKVDLTTGKAEKKVAIDPALFGEGITIVRDTVYQLTWQNHKLLVYSLPDLKLIKEYPLDTEGWGITSNGTELIVSDGTSTLYYYDPAGFKLLRTQSITEAGSLTYNLNELEYIDGYIYANQWQQPFILKIDPASGIIVAKANLENMWTRVKQVDPAADVPNGIAYDPDTKKIYVTGKNWPELYEVRFSQ